MRLLSRLSNKIIAFVLGISDSKVGGVSGCTGYYNFTGLSPDEAQPLFAIDNRRDV